MTEALEQQAQELVERYPTPAGALQPLIELVQAATGGCAEDEIRWLAAHTGLSVAHVAGVVSSRGAAGGAEIVRVCCGLSCRLMGADAVTAQLQAATGVEVVAAPCLGVCSAAPALERGGRVHDGLTPERIDTLVAGGA